MLHDSFSLFDAQKKGGITVPAKARSGPSKLMEGNEPTDLRI